MAKPREPKATDQENTEKAYRMLHDFVKSHPEIETSLWYGAFISAFVNGHFESGITFEQFCDILEDIKQTYKSWF